MRGKSLSQDAAEGESVLLQVRVSRQWANCLQATTDAKNTRSDLLREALLRFLKSQGHNPCECATCIKAAKPPKK